MGYPRHNAVIAVVPRYVASRMFPDVPVPDVEGFRESLPQQWRPLVVGPIPSVINGYVTYVFAPDGSNEGWPDSDDGDRYRHRFAELFSFTFPDGSSPYNVLVIDARFGGDEPGAGHEDELIVSTLHSTWRNHG